MDKLLVTVFPSESQAEAGSQILQELQDEGSLVVTAAAVVVKHPDGTLSAREIAHESPRALVAGALIGALVGSLGGLPGAAIGLAGGGLVATMFDFVRLGVGEDFLDEVGDYLQPGKAAVVALVDETWVLPVDTRMEAAGGTVFRRARSDLEDVLLEQDLQALRAEINALDVERARAIGEARAKLQARLEAIGEKLERKTERARQSIEDARRLADAKAELLEAQAARLDGERKTMLQERAAQVRTDFERRRARLEQAIRVTRKAMAA